MEGHLNRYDEEFRRRAVDWQIHYRTSVSPAPGDIKKTRSTRGVHDPTRISGSENSVAVENGVSWVSHQRNGLPASRSNDNGQSWTRILADGRINRAKDSSVAGRRSNKYWLEFVLRRIPIRFPVDWDIQPWTGRIQNTQYY